MTGPDALLASQTAFQVLDEIPLVERIGRPLERIDAFANLDDGRDGRNATEGARRMSAVLRRQLESEVSSKRVTRNGYGRQPVDRNELVDHVSDVRGQP